MFILQAQGPPRSRGHQCAVPMWDCVPHLVRVRGGWQAPMRWWAVGLVVVPPLAEARVDPSNPRVVRPVAGKLPRVGGGDHVGVPWLTLAVGVRRPLGDIPPAGARQRMYIPVHFLVVVVGPRQPAAPVDRSRGGCDARCTRYGGRHRRRRRRQRCFRGAPRHASAAPWLGGGCPLWLPPRRKVLLPPPLYYSRVLAIFNVMAALATGGLGVSSVLSTRGKGQL